MHLDVPPGTLVMLVLQTLAREPLHGYAIAKRIKELSEDALQVEEGSLYPALQRVLLKGWATAEWVRSGPKRRLRVYTITAEGRRQLEAEVAGFQRVFAAIARVVQPA
ncbi:MAG TPA: PadR family transcriptional regulator [Solibacterales bacterium]|nr:PadR family transcriptional regulator [Bryobacterales bacterium]